MNKSLAFGIAVLTVVASSTYGQGTVSFQNQSTNKITRIDTGANVANSPAGGWKVQLYWLDGNLAQPTTDMFTDATKVGAAANIGVPVAGQFSGGTITIPTTAAGGPVWLQLKAWEAAFGATYEAAVGNQTPSGGRLALAGTSNIFKLAATGNPNPPATTPMGINPLLSFTLVPVPEPAAIGLGLLGFGTLLLLRRRS